MYSESYVYPPQRFRPSPPHLAQMPQQGAYYPAFYGNPQMPAYNQPYPPQMYPQFQGGGYAGAYGNNQPAGNGPYHSSNEAFLFENPLNPGYHHTKAEQPGSGGYLNPYPKYMYPQKPSQPVQGSFLNSFKSQDGSIDFNKMMNTAGQMMNAVNQVSSMVKGLGGLFKT